MVKKKAKVVPRKVIINARPALAEMNSKWPGVSAKMYSKRPGIRRITRTILTDFQPLGAKQVNWRLNVSITTLKLPVFIDWFAEKLTLSNRSGLPADKKNGNPDWGLYRFGDGLASKVYDDAVGPPPQLIHRDWSQGEDEKRAESLKLVKKAGLNYQKFIGIIATDGYNKGRCVGALTVSFKSDPNTTAVDDKMKQWAGWSPWPGKQKISPLVNYVTENFILGGPKITPPLKRP